MKALVYHGPGQKSWDSVDDPKPTDPTDIVVRIDTTTICGTDLHILKGDVPAVTDGRVLGHEAVGTVVEVGSVDLADSRLEHARRFGADHVLNGRAGDLEAQIAALTTAGLGADVAIEAV